MRRLSSIAHAREKTRNVTGQWSLLSCRIQAKIALALLLLGTPAASMVQTAGEAGAGNVPISGIPPGPANVSGLNNINVDPSGIDKAAKLPALSPPHIRVPQIPQAK